MSAPPSETLPYEFTEPDFVSAINSVTVAMGREALLVCRHYHTDARIR